MSDFTPASGSHATPDPGPVPDPGTPAGPVPRLRVTHHCPRPGVAVVRPAGEMDAVGAPSVADRVGDLIPSCELVVLDMRRVTFLDAGGIHTLLTCTRDARRQAARLLVVGLDPAFHRVLRICGVESELTLTDVCDGERIVGVGFPCGDTADTEVPDPGADRPIAGA